MTQNVNDSILFLMSARNALEETVKLSDVMDNNEIDQSVGYIQNEASDLQIIEEKYDSELEEAYFELYKDFVLENFSELSESINSDSLKSIVYETGPISDYGLSSNRTIMEHMHITGVSNMLMEGPKIDKLKQKSGFTWVTNKVSGAGQWVSNSKVGQYTGDKWIKTKTKASKVGQYAGDKWNKVGDAAKKYSGYKDIKAGRKQIKSTKNRTTVKDMIKDKIKAAKNRTTVKDMMKDEIKAGKKARLKGSIKMTTTAAVLAAVGYGATKAYKAYMTKAARACRGSEDKQACMSKYRSQAVNAQISKTQSGISACNNAKNPDKCKEGIQAKVQKLKAKLDQ